MIHKDNSPFDDALVLGALLTAKQVMDETAKEVLKVVQGRSDTSRNEGAELLLIRQMEMVMRTIASNLTAPTPMRLAAMRSADIFLAPLIAARVYGQQASQDVIEQPLPLMWRRPRRKARAAALPMNRQVSRRTKAADARGGFNEALTT